MVDFVCSPKAFTNSSQIFLVSPDSGPSPPPESHAEVPAQPLARLEAESPGKPWSKPRKLKGGGPKVLTAWTTAEHIQTHFEHILNAYVLQMR